MHNVLRQILKKKKNDLRNKRRVYRHPEPRLNRGELVSGSSARKILRIAQNDTFFNTLKKVKGGAIIGEIKFASPSAGVLGLGNDLVKKANAYKKAGVDAVSVITEKYFFHGDPGFVPLVKKTTGVPVLQKDFVIDESQIYEAKQLGSDALLLIVKIVPLKKLQEFVKICFTEGIEPVVEVHNDEDLQKALLTNTRVIAVNARDLDTFSVSVETACRLLKKIPAKYLRLGFSGVLSKEEFKKYIEAGAQGVLIGTTLMRKEDPHEFISSLKTK